MIRFLVRRLLTGVALVLALTFLTFAVFFLIPSNPVCLAIDCGPKNTTTEAEIRAAEHRLGLDRPVLVQYGDFLWRLVRHGSFGYSYRGHFSVNTTLASAVPATASLVAGGAVLLVLLALPLGALSALRPHGLLDRGALAVSMVGIALHPFVLALLLRSAFADHLRIAPGIGYCPLLGQAEPRPTSPFPGAPIMAGCGGLRDWAYHLYLPWLVFALFFLPMYARMFRARVLQTLGERYVQAAYAKGGSGFHVFRSHVLRNSVTPILPMLAMDVGTAITAAIYVETVFKLGGLGTLAVNALSGEWGGYDLPTIVGVVFVVAAAVVVLNLIADLALVALDPRITGRSGRRSIWRQADGGLNRRRVATVTAAVAAATIAASAYAAVHRGGTGGPVTGKAGIARYAKGGKPIAGARWTELLTKNRSWTQLPQMSEEGGILVTIRRITVGPNGWTVAATIVNKTDATLTVHKGTPMVEGVADTGSGGFSLQYRARAPFLNAALPARAYQPALPPLLPQGARWTGTFAGAGTLRPGTELHVGVGIFRGVPKERDPYGFTLVTTRSFRSP